MCDWKCALAIAAALSGFFSGVHWESRKHAEAVAAADSARTDAALAHQATVLSLNAQLTETRSKLYDLTTGRMCLGAPAVRLLNNQVPDASGKPAGTPGAFATDRDVGRALADCRTRYAKVSDQLNKLLDLQGR